eukprot:11188889-Ditylum_brightwellii.AAC.1
MGKSSRRRQRDTSTLKRIEQNIERSNSISNPLIDLGLTALTSFEFSSPSTIPAANYVIRFFQSPLPSDLHKECLSLFEKNMAELYRNSSW